MSHKLFYTLPKHARRDYADWQALSGEEKSLDDMLFDTIVSYCTRAGAQVRMGEVQVRKKLVPPGHPAAFTGKLSLTEADLTHIDVLHEEAKKAVKAANTGVLVLEFGDATWAKMEQAYKLAIFVSLNIGGPRQGTYEKFWSDVLTAMINSILAKHDQSVMLAEHKKIKAASAAAKEGV